MTYNYNSGALHYTSWDIIGIGDSLSIDGLSLYINSKQGSESTGYWLRGTLTFPITGNSITVDIGVNGTHTNGYWPNDTGRTWVQPDFSPLSDPVFYDGEFAGQDASFYEQYSIDCGDATWFGSTLFINIRIGRRTDYIATFFSDCDNGSDSNRGICWEDAFATLETPAAVINTGMKLKMAMGDYTVDQETVPQFYPTYTSYTGIQYVIEDVNSTGLDYVIAGIKPEQALLDFEHSAYGQFIADWGTTGYDYIRGWYSAYTTFVSSDVMLSTTGYKLEVLYNDDSSLPAVYSGYGLILEDGWKLEVIDIASGTAEIDVTLDAVTQETFYLDEGDDLIYEHTIDSVDIPIIVAHIDTIFEGTETNAVFFKGVVQVASDITDFS